ALRSGANETSSRHADRHGFPVARQRREKRARIWPGRFARAHCRRGPGASQQCATGQASGVRRTVRRKCQPDEPGLFRQSQEFVSMSWRREIKMKSKNIGGDLTLTLNLLLVPSN